MEKKESEYSNRIFETFRSTFPEDWLNSIKDLTDETKIEWLYKIDQFQYLMCENFSKFVLSGDFFITKKEKLEKLFSQTYKEEIPAIKDNQTLEAKLIQHYTDLLADIQESITLIKYHSSICSKKFNATTNKKSINAIKYNKRRVARNRLVDLLKLICDICWYEYNLSYENDSIEQLLSFKEALKDISSDKNFLRLNSVINPTIEKVQLLLEKLSHLSSEKEISYSINSIINTIKISPKTENIRDFRNLYLKFFNPNSIIEETIRQWQKEALQENVDMWKYALLMRYYNKVTKSEEQINNLLKLSERHYEDHLKDNKDNYIEDYANRSFRNYMHNSKFSFMCNKDEYDFKHMKDDLKKIEQVQSETFIFNYYPYLKATQYTINYIEEEISENTKLSKEELKKSLNFLHHCYNKFKENLEWSYTNQPYLIQMRFNFCRIDSNIELGETDTNNFKVFYPSSFCRPIDFEKVKEINIKLRTQIALLDYHVKHIDEKLELINAQEKIKKIEQKNLEYLGLFSTLMTFLVGLLSIFIGNNGNVSIFEKMEYVIALGGILTILLIVGYILINDKITKEWKLSISIFILVSLFFFKYLLL